MDLWLTMQLQSMKGNFIRNLRTNMRDSLLLVDQDNLFEYSAFLIQSDQYNVRNEYDKAICLLTDYSPQQKEYEHDVAQKYFAYTL